MQGFRNLILLTTSCILTHVLGNVRNDGDTCLSNVQWRVLWKEIDNLNNNAYSVDCIFIPRGNLCNATEMITTVLSNHAAIAQVLQSIMKLFLREGNPIPNVSEFLMHIHQQYDHLRTCLQPNINLSSPDARVAQCFQHLHEFLNNHPNTICTWQMLSSDSMVMLQLLEQKKGKHHSLL